MGDIRRRSVTYIVAQQVAIRSEEKADIDRVDFISTGCTLLNLAASQKGRKGGWARGRIINIVGDKSTCKTLLTLEAFAQAFYNIKKIKSTLWPTPSKISLVYNNGEGVMDLPVERMYGQRFVDAVEWIPDGNNERQGPMTCEGFGRDLLGRIDKLQKGEALFYAMDSLDSLMPESGVNKMEKSIKTGDALEVGYGSGMAKANYFSNEFFGNLCSRMAGKDVTVFMISQIRDIINAQSFGEKKKRTGGKALDFYAHQVPWLAQVGKLKNKFGDESRVYGTTNKALFKKNKCGIPFREAEFNILFNYGIDDIMSCAEFLTPAELTEVHGGKRMSREEFVKLADDNSEIKEKLINAVEKKWALIEENTRVCRNDRWGG